MRRNVRSAENLLIFVFTVWVMPPNSKPIYHYRRRSVRHVHRPSIAYMGMTPLQIIGQAENKSHWMCRRAIAFLYAEVSASKKPKLDAKQYQSMMHLGRTMPSYAGLHTYA